jgi:16S rRNA processing protein RimM
MEFTNIGRILKTKGYDGTTIVEFYHENISTAFKAVFIDKGNQKTPLLLSKIDLVDEFTANILWTKYNSKELAVSLNNCEIYMASDIVKDHFDMEEEDNYIGYEVHNFGEKIGLVSDVLQNQFQEIIEITTEDKKTILIPFIDEMIVTIDEDLRVIYCELDAEYLKTFTS